MGAAALCLILIFAAFVQTQIPQTREEKIAVAQKATDEASALVDKGTPESLKTAIEKFNRFVEPGNPHYRAAFVLIGNWR